MCNRGCETPEGHDGPQGPAGIVATILVPDYFELVVLRKQVCALAGRLTNGWRPEFNFTRGMAWYAIAYMIDMLQGKEISEYAQAQIRYYGRKVFPDFCQQVTHRLTEQR